MIYLESFSNHANFKSWFKGSKVIDKNGKPLLVYHGTMKKKLVNIHKRADMVEKLYNQIYKHMGIDDTFELPISTTFGEKFKSFNDGHLSQISNWDRKNPGVLDKKDIEFIYTDYVPFDEFDKDLRGSNTEANDANIGFFFTPNPDFAQRFTYKVEVPMIGGHRIGKDKYTYSNTAHIYKAYLKILNPIKLINISKEKATEYDKLFEYYDENELRKLSRSTAGSKELQTYLSRKYSDDDLKKLGYDGIINKVHWDKKSQLEYIVFDNDQIWIVN